MKRKKKPNETADATHPALRDYFGYCLYKAAMRLRSMIDEALKSHGVVAPQLGLLRLIQENEQNLTQNELCAIMAIDSASMVKFLDGLEKKKFIKRCGCPKDRRAKQVHLSPKGKDFLKLVSKKRTLVEKDFLKDLTMEEQQALRTIIPKLLPLSSD